MPSVSLSDPIGPLQLRVMNHLWQVESGTVQDVADAVNAQGGTKLAYTTYLTVMRNLTKRGMLDQRKTTTKRQQFVVLVDEFTYKSHVLKALYRDYCDNNPAQLKRYLNA